MDNDKGAAPELTKSTQLLLRNTIEELKAAVSQPTSGEERLFFPHGIELIRVEVKVGLNDVELTIAGGKQAEQVRAHFATRLDGLPFVDTTDDVNKDPIHPDDHVHWHNSLPYPVLITFPPRDGCPFDPPDCSFKLEKSGDPQNRENRLTRVRHGAIGGGTEYQYTRGLPADANIKFIRGDPKIIIQ